MTSSAPEQVPKREGISPTVYFVDGYHGGVVGHMPPGCWRDILERMRQEPDWKISLDVEPISFDHLKRVDPHSYREIACLLEETGPAARVEIVAASYAQPFAWAIGGESNIRHLLYGLRTMERHFPALAIDTYAVQEPCFTSCLPQVLRSLGFRRAVLKNSTAWGGYCRGFDAEVVKWVGPDGTWLPCVPRYALEELIRCCDLESGYGTVEYAEKCLAHGINRPSGMYFQDLGWQAHPKVRGEHIQYVTWREYMELIAPEPVEEWHFSQEDILCTLPWGEGELQQLARQVRAAENRILVTEKLAAMAAVYAGLPFPQDRLTLAWEQLLMAQHHDAWICARTRSGRDNWAWRVGAETWVTEEICRELAAQSLEAIVAACGQGVPRSSAKEQWVLVCNTLGGARHDVAQVEIATPPETKSVLVTDSAGNRVASQIRVLRQYDDDGSISAARVFFSAQVPSLGFRAYRLQPVDQEPGPCSTGASAVQSDKDVLVLETDIYRVEIDTSRGGVIRSLYGKAEETEYCDRRSPHGFNAYQGYFISEERWLSSTDSPVEVEIEENGPVRASVRLRGVMADLSYTSTITLTQESRRIDCRVVFDYQRPTWIGDPVDIAPEARREERRRSHHDDRWKLKALFPVRLTAPIVYKDAPYDVCRSKLDDTFFQRWDEIKHNIILHWVDLYATTEDRGLAIFSDHTTSYSHGPDHPLALTLGWGWEGGFWWGKCPLTGRKEIRYAIVPHAGRWDQADISREYRRWSEPLVSQLSANSLREMIGSLFELSGEGVEIPTLLVEDGDLLVRLYNARGQERRCVLTFPFRPRRVTLVDLRGRCQEELAISPAHDGGCQIGLDLPPFGLRTLRLAGVGGGTLVKSYSG